MDKQQIREILQLFPSTFEFDKHFLRRHRAQELSQKLQIDYDATVKTDEEESKINNFLSYLQHRLGKTDNALKHCELALCNDPKNVIANANKCKILLETSNVKAAEEVLLFLLEIKEEPDYKSRELEAQADIAYAYSRAGPVYSQKAEHIYCSIIPECPRKYQWKYGLGLVLARQTHLLNSLQKDILQNSGEKLSKAVELFLDVTQQTEGSDKTMCAGAWAHIGEIIYCKFHSSANIEIPVVLKRCKPFDCFKKAEKLAPDDPFVLERCGKYYRYFKQIEQSEILLRKAIAVRETAFAYHHLALTLKRKVVYDPQHPGHSIGDYVSVLINNASEAKILANNEAFLEAKECMLKAVKITSTAPMLRELALMYRMLDSPDKALEILNKVISNKTLDISGIELVNVYEQKGMCMLDISEKIDNQTEKLKLKEDAECILFNAIELQAKLIREDKLLRNAWQSHPTLLKVIEADTSPSSKSKLAKLHRLISKHGISLLRQLQDREDVPLNEKESMALIEHYMTKGNFTEAMILLNILEFTDSFESLNKDFVMEIYIQGALHSIQREDLPMARSRLRSAYNVAKFAMQKETTLLNVSSIPDKTTAGGNADENRFLPTKGEADNSNNQCCFEVHIVHACTRRDRCQSPRKLSTIFETYTDLKVTVNAEEILCEDKSLAMISIMQSSDYILILAQNEYDSQAEHYIEQAIKESEKSKNIIVAAPENAKLPAKLNTPAIRKMKLPDDLFNCSMDDGSGDVGTFKDFGITVLRNFFSVLHRI